MGKASLSEESAILVGETLFFYIIGLRYPAKAEILSINKETFKAVLSFPARPDMCDWCGHGRNLSTNDTTGIVICMTTGCGQDFGYQPGHMTEMKVSDFQ